MEPSNDVFDDVNGIYDVDDDYDVDDVDDVSCLHYTWSCIYLFRS